MSSSKPLPSYHYFTNWILVISFSIIILSLFIKIPLCILLFAYAAIATTSMIGSLIFVIPNIHISNTIVDADMKAHLFPFIVANALIPFCNFFIESKYTFWLSLLIFTFVLIIYCSTINSKNSYKKFYDLESQEELEKRKEIIYLIMIGFIFVLFCSNYRLYYKICL